MAEYSNTVIEYALRVQEKYNVPASVTLGAYKYESAGGTSALARNNQNYFGITGTGTAGSTKGSSHTWAKYNSMWESFDAFGKLMSSEKYSNLTKDAKNVDEYARAYANTYAPPSDGNVNYADTLIKIIHRDNLTQYDKVEFTGSGISAGSAQSTAEAVSTGNDDGFIKRTVKSIVLVVAILLLVVAGLFFLAKTFDISPQKIATNTVMKKAGIKSKGKKSGKGAESDPTLPDPGVE